MARSYASRCPQLEVLTYLMPRMITNNTTETLIATMVALKRALSLMPTTRIAGDDQGDHERRQVETNLDAEDAGRSQQIVCPLHQFSRLRSS